MSVDRSRFRELWSGFPAGVTVVTARSEEGHPRGLTCTAVSPVCDQPPLVLVVMNQESNSLPAVLRSGAFALNFLASGDEATARRFAAKGANKFDDVEWRASSLANGAPLLSGTLAYAECLVEAVIPLGTHKLIVGLVMGAEISSGDPLMYLRRSFFDGDGDSLVLSRNG